MLYGRSYLLLRLGFAFSHRVMFNLVLQIRIHRFSVVLQSDLEVHFNLDSQWPGGISMEFDAGDGHRCKIAG